MLLLSDDSRTAPPRLSIKLTTVATIPSTLQLNSAFTAADEAILDAFLTSRVNDWPFTYVPIRS